MEKSVEFVEKLWFSTGKSGFSQNRQKIMPYIFLHKSADNPKVTVLRYRLQKGNQRSELLEKVWFFSPVPGAQWAILAEVPKIFVNNRQTFCRIIPPLREIMGLPCFWGGTPCREK